MRLQALIESGRRAHYLCFNKNLAKAIRARFPEYEANVESVDKFYMGLVRSAGLELAVPKSEATLPQYFQVELPELVFKAVDGGGVMPYDAIIIDEGQDFSEDQLYAANELLCGDGEYAVFADARQDVFGRGTKAYGAEVMFSLHHNCRNTGQINRRANRLTGMSIESMPGVPEGVEPEVHLCRSRDAMAMRAWQLARQWKTKEEAVAILSPYTLEKSCMASSQTAHRLELSEDVELAQAPSTVLYSSIKAFKGLEASAVIVVDLSMPGQQRALGEDDVYVACTRARARLALMTTDEQVAMWLRGGRTTGVPAPVSRGRLCPWGRPPTAWPRGEGIREASPAAGAAVPRSGAIAALGWAHGPAPYLDRKRWAVSAAPERQGPAAGSAPLTAVDSKGHPSADAGLDGLAATTAGDALASHASGSAGSSHISSAFPKPLTRMRARVTTADDEGAQGISHAATTPSPTHAGHAHRDAAAAARFARARGARRRRADSTRDRSRAARARSSVSKRPAAAKRKHVAASSSLPSRQRPCPALNPRRSSRSAHFGSWP